jgi:hypothetical protein
MKIAAQKLLPPSDQKDIIYHQTHKQSSQNSAGICCFL